MIPKLASKCRKATDLHYVGFPLPMICPRSVDARDADKVTRNVLVIPLSKPEICVTTGTGLSPCHKTVQACIGCKEGTQDSSLLMPIELPEIEISHDN